MRFGIVLTAIMLFLGHSNAQITLYSSPEDSVLQNLEARLGLVESNYEKDSRVLISGYVQAQWQKADTAGISNPSAGTFPANVDNRLMIRRGRLKAAYNYTTLEGINLTSITIQIDATPGGISLRDAFGRFTDPWTNWFSLKAGVFYRPFGHEVALSSSERESPERTRYSNTLFPSERDMGATIIIAAPKTSRWSGTSLEGGLFNGTSGVFNEYDNKKDFIGQLQVNRSNIAETFKWITGVSYYNGGNKLANKYKFDLMETGPGIKRWIVTDSSEANIQKFVKRKMVGINGMISVETKIGITTFRGEYVRGTQAGTSSSTSTATTLPTANQFERPFFGAYVNLVQNLFRSKHNIVLKYDWYDPNTDVKGQDIGVAGSNLSLADIKYSTFGIGYLFAYDHSWRFSIYKDFVHNEITKLNGFNYDLKDNILTIRIQYRFNII